MTPKRISIKFIVLYSGVAQLAEQVTVNHLVGGSNPSSGGGLSMAIYTIMTGFLLVLLGVTGYFSYDTVTVLIPAFLGALISIFGVLALKVQRKRKFIHLAIVIVVIGLAASASSLGSILTLLSCETISSCDKVSRPVAVLFKSIMALILIPYFLAAISFFIRARLSK